MFFSRSFLANKMKGTNISIFLYLFNVIKSFIPQAWSHLFAFSVFFKFCCLSQSLIVSFKRPGLANLIKNTPSFIRSGYLESILRRSQVSFYLHLSFSSDFSLVLSIFLRLSTAFKIFHIFVCQHFNPNNSNSNATAVFPIVT